MRLLLFIPPKEFRDESLSIVKLFCDKWGIECKITSYTSNECVGSHGAVYRPDVHTSKVNAAEYDGVVLIDGLGVDAYKLFDYRPLLDLMLKFNDSKKFIIAVNNAIKIPARANIIRNLKISTDDNETRRLVVLFHGMPTDNRHEINGNIITIRNSADIEDSMPVVLEHMGVR